MDPYLEGARWPGFHHDLATEVKRQLMPRLLPGYYADTATYFLVVSYDDVVIAEVMPHPMPHSLVEIRSLEKRSLVAAIEFLSPTNKKGEGRKQYLRKRSQILQSSAHLVEIDLLRKGRRVPLKGKVPPAAYFVLLSRAEERPDVEVWPIALNQLLPTVPVPLLKGDADVLLDLQQAVTAVYDLARYDLILRYDRAPDVPLTRRESAWAQELLPRADTAQS
jgi:hypothetical protein